MLCGLASLVGYRQQEHLSKPPPHRYLTGKDRRSTELTLSCSTQEAPGQQQVAPSQ